MFDATLDISVHGAPVSFNRVNQDNYSAVYRGSNADGSEKHNLTISHTLPTGAKPSESHLVRLDTEIYLAGVYQRTDSVWFVMRTNNGTQDDTGMTHHSLALIGFLNSSANLGKVLNRES